MCDRCELLAAIEAHGLNPLFERASTRCGRVTAASVGETLEQAEASGGIVTPSQDQFLRAVAAAAGVDRLDVARLVVSMAGAAVQGVMHGHEVVEVMEGSATQTFLFGWLLRDEQLKVERAAAEG